MQITYSIQYRSGQGSIQTIRVSFHSTELTFPEHAMVTLEKELLEAPLQLLVASQADLLDVHRIEPTYRDLTAWAIREWQSDGPM